MTFARRPGPLGRFNRRGLGSGGGFRPTQLSGCVLWLRADMGITKDGSDKVSAWADQSVSGLSAAQGTGAAQPTWVSGGLGGQPLIRFNAAHRLETAALDWTAVTDSTVMIVHAGVSTGNYALLVKENAPVGTIEDHLIFSGAFGANALHTVSKHTGSARAYKARTTGGPTAGNVITVSRVTQANAAATELEAWYNGTLATWTHQSDVASSGGGTNSPFCIGARSDGTVRLVGDIYEIAVFDNSLSTAGRQRLQQYAGARYGITVA